MVGRSGRSHVTKNTKLLYSRHSKLTQDVPLTKSTKAPSGFLSAALRSLVPGFRFFPREFGTYANRPE